MKAQVKKVEVKCGKSLGKKVALLVAMISLNGASLFAQNLVSPQFLRCEERENALRAEVERALPPQEFARYQAANRSQAMDVASRIRASGILEPVNNHPGGSTARPGPSVRRGIQNYVNAALRESQLDLPPAQMICPTGFSLDRTQINNRHYLQPHGEITYISDLPRACVRDGQVSGPLQYMQVTPNFYWASGSTPAASAGYRPDINVSTHVNSPISVRFRGHVLILGQRSFSGHYDYNENRYIPYRNIISPYSTDVTLEDGNHIGLETYFNRYLPAECQNFRHSRLAVLTGPATPDGGGNGGGGGGGAIPTRPNQVNGNGGGGSGGNNDPDSSIAMSEGPIEADAVGATDTIQSK